MKILAGRKVSRATGKKRRKMRRFSREALLLLFALGVVLSIVEVGLICSTEAKENGVPYYTKLSIDAEEHNDYGFSYPVTYQFSILADSSNLKAYKKHIESEDWIQITEKTSADFFNGVEAVRFDYQHNKAYVSIAFGDISDEIFLKIVDQFQNPVATYDGIPKYYDNRDAAVVFSADDWDGTPYIDWSFREVSDMFTRKELWLSVGIITQGYRDDPIWGDTPSPDWSSIQEKIDAGYIEVVSHSRTHPPDVPYDNYDYEIGGSKLDIINSLDLPSLYKKGSSEYVWGFTAPHSKFDETMRRKLGGYKYLTFLAGYPYAEPKYYQDGSFPPWDARYGLYEKWNRWAYLENESLSVLNYQFDRRIAAGKIYHIGLHPWALDFFSGSKLDRHTDHVKGRKNLWYVGYGALMMYHYVEDREVVTVEEEYAPFLSWTGEEDYQEDGIDPEFGNLQTNFIYRVKYTDQDNNAPAQGFPKVHILKGGSEITGSPFSMSEVNAGDVDYTDGKIYSYTKTGLDDGVDYTYYFEAHDVQDRIAVGDPTSEREGPMVDSAVPQTFLDEKPEGTVVGDIGKITARFVWHGEDNITSPDNLVYSYKLVNYDTDWSEWSSSTTVTYLLSRGNYTFYARARDEAGSYPAEDDPNTAQWSFQVLIPIIAYPNPYYLNRDQTVRIANLALNSEVRIYSLSGELVRTLAEGVEMEGDLQEAMWDGKNKEGQEVVGGIYIYLVIGPHEIITGKIAIIK